MSNLGEVIFDTCDEQGPIQVHQNGDRRTLTFGNQVEQSGLSLIDPARLEYVYTQAMALVLLFVPAFRNALVLGLGGGALVRALREQVPRGRVHAVEQRAAVIQVARSHFQLDRDPLVRLVAAEAAEFLRGSPPPMGLVFADLYRAEGMDETQIHQGFLRDCRDLLTADGVFVANLWGSEYQDTREANRQLRAVFHDRVLFNHVQGGNIVAFGFAGDLPRLARKRFFAAAQALGLAMRIPLQKLARNLWRQNAEALQLGHCTANRS